MKTKIFVNEIFNEEYRNVLLDSVDNRSNNDNQFQNK